MNREEPVCGITHTHTPQLVVVVVLVVKAQSRVDDGPWPSRELAGSLCDDHNE